MPQETTPQPSEPQGRRPEGATRRSVVRGVAVGGLALPLLAACGSTSDESGEAPRAAGPSPSAQGSDGSAGGGSQPLTTTGKVPEGGGEILQQARLVVTQPSHGEFKCFSAVCTHAGCLVGSVQNGAIICPCHGSRFSVKDGSVLNGPASRPLPAYKITVKGTKIIRS